MNSRIQILLSSYNGQQFIRKQLDSIINQDTEVSLLIRDDGSKDDTVAIIEEYEQSYSFIEHKACSNIGVIKSFFELIRMADKSKEYFALCDQDDIWFEDKLSRAMAILDTMDNSKPLLYCGEQTLIDGDDKELTVSMLSVNKKAGFGNSIVENIATGCTCVFNRAMLDLLCSYEPEHTIMHDWWIYMIASSMGEVYYDKKPCIYYRQHGNNTMGSRTNYFEEFKQRFKRFSGNKGKLFDQLVSFNNADFPLNDEDKAIMDMVLQYRTSLKYRAKCVFSKKVYRQRFMDNVIFKMLFLTNHI